MTITTLTVSPLYEQVKKAILERIVAGEWGPGEFLPSETALAKEYNVSQGTLRKALNTLTREKKVTRYQGKGTAVAIMDEQRVLFHFFPLRDRAGKRVFPVSNIHYVQCRRPSALEQAALDIAADAQVVHFNRTRSLENSPVINEHITLPLARFPLFPTDTKAIPNPLYEYYQRTFGVTVSKASEQIDVVIPDSNDAELLNVSTQHPLLRITRIAFDLQNQPVEYRVSHINTERYIYETDLY